MSAPRRRPAAADPVDSTLPVLPLLDMTFQLLAFFVFTFRVSPTEGQLALAMPRVEGNGNAPVVGPLADTPAVFVVHAEATAAGAIDTITLADREAPQVKPLDLGADLVALRAELARRHAALRDRPARLLVEMGDGLRQEHAVALLDAGVRAGFADIAPVPADASKR